MVMDEWNEWGGFLGQGGFEEQSSRAAEGRRAEFQVAAVGRGRGMVGLHGLRVPGLAGTCGTWS